MYFFNVPVIVKKKGNITFLKMFMLKQGDHTLLSEPNNIDERMNTVCRKFSKFADSFDTFFRIFLLSNLKKRKIKLCRN